MSDKGGLQLIPETRKKIEVSVPGENRTLYWGIGFMIVVGIVYGGLFAYASSLEQKLVDINSQIDTQEKTRDYAKEKEIILVNKQLQSVSNVLDKHTYMSRAISRFKSVLQPQIELNTIKIQSTGGIFTVSGKIDSYTMMAKQLASFLSDDGIKETKITTFKKIANGIVEFGGDIIVNPAVYFK